MADYVSCLSESIEGIITDVRDVVEKILRFAELSEPAEIVRESAVLLRLLEPLAGNDTANTPGSCGAAEGFQSMESLAMMASSITTFLTELRLTSARLAYLCTEDSLYNRDFITAIGDLMEELADLLAALGDVENGERIRYGKVYTDKVTVGVMIKYQILSTQFRPNWRSWRRWTPMVWIAWLSTSALNLERSRQRRKHWRNWPLSLTRWELRIFSSNSEPTSNWTSGQCSFNSPGQKYAP